MGARIPFFPLFARETAPQIPPYRRPDPVDVLIDMMNGREITVYLPPALERRLRASLHRMNADIQSGGSGLELFDVDDDVSTVLVAMAERGLEEAEAEDGVDYDPLTGYPR